MKLLKLLFVFLACAVVTSGWQQAPELVIEEPPEEKPLPLTADVLALRDRIDSIIIGYSPRGFDYSLKVMSLDKPQVIYEHRQDEPLIPASNLKVITTAAAFHFFGPEYRFQTQFYLSGLSDLYIKPSGDPTWNDAYKHQNLDSIFIAIADSLKKAQVKTINNIYIEQGTYDDYQIQNNWKQDNLTQAYSAKPSIVAFNDNCAQVLVKPTTPGQLAEVEIYPVNTGYEVVNNVYTTSNRRIQGLHFAPDTLSNFVQISGNIYSRSKFQYRHFAIPRPDLYALAVLREKFTEFEIDYAGDFTYIQMDDRTFKKNKYKPLFTLESIRLKYIAHEVNKYSNNFTANQLFMHLGETKGHVWQTENIIKDWLVEAGIPIVNLKMYDGSGLSPFNRCTTNNLVNVLKAMHRKEYFEDYKQSFAISGVDGTIRRTLKTPTLTGKVNAKTGYILGARALSGYITTADDELLAFSFIANKYGASLGFFMEMAEKVLDQLALFSREDASL